jgi:hypothetical protein
MSRLRRNFAVIAGSVLLATFVTGTALAATWTSKVTPPTAKPGDGITVVIDAFGGPEVYGPDLYLFPARSWVEGANCGDIAGASVIAAIEWNSDGLNHQGVATFEAPNLPDGDYGLGDEVFGSCFSAGLLTISSTGTPNTAVPRPAPLPGTWPFLIGAMVLLAWLVVGVRRARAGHDAERSLPR